MGFRINAKDITTNYTQTLAEFTANLKYEDIPPEVLERAKHMAIQTIGVSLGANGLPMAEKAIDIGKSCGTGEPEATLWIDGSKVSMTSAVFCNSTLADMSEEHYRYFYWDTLLKLVNALVEHDLIPYIYTEGPYDSRVECLMDVPKGKTIIHFEEADLVRVKRILGRTACLSGGVSSQVLVNRTPVQVADAVKRNLDILAPGGGCIFDISDTITECDPRNVEALFQTVRYYGDY